MDRDRAAQDILRRVEAALPHQNDRLPGHGAEMLRLKPQRLLDVGEGPLEILALEADGRALVPRLGIVGRGRHRLVEDFERTGKVVDAAAVERPVHQLRDGRVRCLEPVPPELDLHGEAVALVMRLREQTEEPIALGRMGLHVSAHRRAEGVRSRVGGLKHRDAEKDRRKDDRPAHNSGQDRHDADHAIDGRAAEPPDRATAVTLC